MRHLFNAGFDLRSATLREARLKPGWSHEPRFSRGLGHLLPGRLRNSLASFKQSSG